MNRIKFVAGDDRKIKKQSVLPTHIGKQVFKKGAEVEGLMLRPQKSVSELAATIYNRLLILDMLYQDLYEFSPRQEFDNLSNELNIITFAAGNINRQISGRLPYQNLQKPKLRDFCSGLYITMQYIRQTQAEIRRLLFANEDEKIDLQLLIINMTLQDQHSELAELKETCD